jgi:outer membrane lipoprotein-sorting protein
VNILRRLPLSRLLLLCASVLALGVGASAIALAVGAGPVPPPKPLAQAVHDALSGPSVEGVSARVTFTNHLLEGANLAGGSEGPAGLASSPLLSGASGRLWIAKDGRLRLELQGDSGDTQILWDGKTATLYDAANNTLYRCTPRTHEGETSSETGPAHSEAPSVNKIEEAIAHISKHAHVSGATPSDVAGRAAYTVRLSPNEGGSLIGGAELSFDAQNGLPLRAAVYSTKSSEPVIELAASEVSYGPVDSSVFEFSPPSDAKVQQIEPEAQHQPGSSGTGGEHPKLSAHGSGPSTIAVLEAKSSAGGKEPSSLEGLPKVDINGTKASELRTELGTVLSFERSGVRYIVAGAVEAPQVEAIARGL